MKKNISGQLIFSILLLVLVISACKSTPPQKMETVKDEPVVPAKTESVATPVAVPENKPVAEDLAALRDRMESLRNDCLAYKFDTYRSADWALAETSRASGLEAYGVNYDLAKTAFGEAITRYEAIKSTSFEQIVTELDQSIVAARTACVAAGADGYYPEYFVLSDSAAEEARALRSAGDMVAAYDAGQKALLRYRTLENGMQAVALKQKIEQNGFINNPEDFAAAGTKYDEGFAAFGSADPAAFESVVASVSLYFKVKNEGYRFLSDEEVVKTDEIRRLCDSIKASRSMKAAYSDANTFYISAQQNGNAANWEKAYTDYTAATIAFNAVFQEATLKRNAADLAISAAREKQAASTELASQADVVAPLPENAEGFSDDPVVIEEALDGEESK